ncbi:MAG: AAA family ATPase [Christensenellaceae bacterium]|nr:AAA family ATPase [Christensenellaceae bacterium]
MSNTNFNNDRYNLFDFANEQFEYESLIEEEPDERFDIPPEGVCRILITSMFKNVVGSLQKEKRNKINSLINELSQLSYVEIRTRLGTKNSKKFKGIQPATFKFRTSPSERIVYIYGNAANVDNVRICDGDIIFLTYVEIHDQQKNDAIDALKELRRGNLTFFNIVDKIKNDVAICYRDMNEIEFIQPVYFADTNRPILSSSQLKLLNEKPPVIFRGSAGSGKTILSLEYYENLSKSVKSLVYITLTENMRKYATDILERSKIMNPNCVTFNEFCGEKTIRNKILEKRPERFVEVPEKVSRRYPNLSVNNVYTYIRGVIKGGVLNGERGKYSGLISFEEWKNYAKKEQLIDEEIREIYLIAQEYQKKLEKESRYDDNDSAFNLLKNPQIYDCMIIDEVQDLTEIQILALAECCPSHNLYFFGDPNQVINPTIVDFGKIGGIFYRKRENILNIEPRIPQHVLKETWRCGPHLIEYINSLTKLRQQFIGKQDYKDDADERSMRLGLDESYWACYVTNPEIIYDVLDFANQSTECIIIVSDDASEARLEEQLPSLRGRIFTVQSIKGLEYRDVIIYNLISDNEHSFRDMLDGNAKRSTHHRMVFNKYYVACTRAQDRIFICEDKLYDERIERHFFTEQHILPNNDISALRNLISETKNSEDWIKEALHLKKEHRYKQAKEAYLRGKDEFGASVMQIYIDYQNTLDICSVNELELEKLKFAKLFFDSCEYDVSEELFVDTGDEWGAILSQKCNGKKIDNEKVRKAINYYSNFNKQAFINIGNSDYIDTETKKITKLIAEIKQL